jgi:hypothetical protein
MTVQLRFAGWSKRLSSEAAVNEGEAYATGYVEPLNDMRTKLGKGRVSARLGGGGCSKTFFTILP